MGPAGPLVIKALLRSLTVPSLESKAGFACTFLLYAC